MKPLLAPVLTLILLLTTLSAHADDAEALLHQADRARGGDLPGISWVIAIDSHDSDGDSHNVMNAIADSRNTRVEYTEPAKVRGQRVLMVGRNMWFSRPGLQKPVPISPRQRLIGQAANGDIAATRYAEDYAIQASAEETVNGEACLALTLTAKEKNVTYDRIRYWISKARGVGVKAEFYTVSGKLFKAASFEYGNTIEYGGKRIPFVSRMTITDAVNADSITTLRYSEVRAKKPDPSLFELNS